MYCTIYIYLVFTLDKSNILILIYDTIDTRVNKVQKDWVTVGPVGGTQGDAGLSFSAWQLN